MNNEHDVSYCPHDGLCGLTRDSGEAEWAVTGALDALRAEWAAASPRAVESDSPRPRRYYQIAGLTVKVEADLPLTDRTYDARFAAFQVAGPGDDTISLHHHFYLPGVKRQELGEPVYQQPPWAIYRRQTCWVYLGIPPLAGDPTPYQVAAFSHDHAHGHIYNKSSELFQRGDLKSLSHFPSDQILLARVLADRQACYLHAAGMVLDGQGLLFVGHSEAGKSTTVTMLQEEGEILCDDRMILRRWPEGFRIHGTWSHGDVRQVSPATAPLRAILLLEKANTNQLLPITDRGEIVRLLPFFVVKPLVTLDWWHKTLNLVAQIAREVPVYRLQLDRSGRVRTVLKRLVAAKV